MEIAKNKESLSLIRKIVVKGIAVKVCSPSTANLVLVSQSLLYTAGPKYEAS